MSGLLIPGVSAFVFSAPWRFQLGFLGLLF